MNTFDTDFFETFTAIHISYLVVLPMFLSFVFIVCGVWSDVCKLESDNIGVYVILFVFLIFLYAKIGKIVEKAEYVKKINLKYKNTTTYIKTDKKLYYIS